MRNILSRFMRRKSTAHKKSYYGKQDAQHLPTTDQGDVFKALRAASGKRKETEGNSPRVAILKTRALGPSIPTREFNLDSPASLVAVKKSAALGPTAYPIWDPCDACKEAGQLCHARQVCAGRWVKREPLNLIVMDDLDSDFKRGAGIMRAMGGGFKFAETITPNRDPRIFADANDKNNL